MLIMLGGCDGKEMKDDVSKMPEDKPYNRVVMETENGYYYNVCDMNLSLRYTEKTTGKDIFLCARPECMHDGNEKCTATYNFLEISNSILYDNSIYFVANIILFCDIYMDWLFFCTFSSVSSTIFLFHSVIICLQ